MKHYYITDSTQPEGFVEVTESEWFDLLGEGDNRIYSSKVYKGIMTLDEVPEENREIVATIVANKIAKWGEYQEQDISSDEFGDMIKEAL